MVKRTYYADQIREEEAKSLMRIERLKEEARIDRTETCFAGKGKVHSRSLTPFPEEAKRLRTQRYW